MRDDTAPIIAMPALDKIVIKGYKSIASAEVEVRPINVLIGANGSGKSNFLSAFSFLARIREGRLREHVAKSGGAGRLLHFGPKVTESMFFRLSFDDERNGYDVTLEPTETDGLVPLSETVYFWDKARHPLKPFDKPLRSRDGEAGISDERQRKGVALHVRQCLKSWRRYHFHDTGSSSPMKATIDLDDNRFLRPDGKNLAAFLYFLRKKHEAVYQQIRKTVRLAAPFFDDFVLEPMRLNEATIRLQWRHRSVSDAIFDAAALSDGTLRFIALGNRSPPPQEKKKFFSLP
ncbi:MAG: AAA family ATPase [Planctomycetes bacterium]|nr:AAA family ATPase [Planctomycetota bacterium]